MAPTKQTAVQISNFGVLPQANAYAGGINECGEKLEIWLRIEESQVVQATFFSNACRHVLLAGNLAVAMAEEKSIGEAGAISGDDVYQASGGLLKGEEHCAQFAAQVLCDALQSYLEQRLQPAWKQLYRRLA